MTYEAKILCDSISPDNIRLTTMEITFPRIVLSEFNTHRIFSRNSASSRAIPVEKQIKKIKENPFIPEYWGKNQKGMQAEEEVSEIDRQEAIKNWLSARDNAVDSTEKLLKIGIHKQITNRLLEPFMWHTVIVTATEWDNFFALRCHKDAQPEIKKIADLIKQKKEKNNPIKIGYKDFHLPLVDFNEQKELQLNKFDLCLVSAGRCARVSYLTHDGKKDPNADTELAKKLLNSGHMSPFEHIARPMNNIVLEKERFSGNFRGWIQYRKTLPNENDYSKIKVQ